MKKWIWIVIAFLCCAFLVTACGSNISTEESSSVPSKENSPVTYTFKCASQMDDTTGWFFYLSYMEDTITQTRNYNFYSYNMRYRFMDGYWNTGFDKTGSGENTIYWVNRTKSGIVGYFSSEKDYPMFEDQRLILQILDNKKTPEELLALKQDDYQFKYFDKTIFFNLLNAALGGDDIDVSAAGETHAAGNGIGAENEYIDGYKFQIAFCHDVPGLIAEIYIDVCYKTGEDYNAYVQLSDLVADGTASEEQNKAFTQIQQIRQAIKQQNFFLAEADSYRDIIVGGIDFSRLYSYLSALHNGDLTGYTGGEKVNAPWISETVTEEEYKKLTEWP